MKMHSRRLFLRHASAGVSLLGGRSLTLAADARPTESTGSFEAYSAALKGFSTLEAPKWDPTVESGDEMFFRRNSPFRGKITPPGEPGTILLIGGRIWGLKTRTPLRNSVLDIWQANAAGQYYRDTRDVFLSRARLITDETGWYEFETIKPGPYKTAVGWRASHIHYRIQYPGYRVLVTQIYFRGDPHQEEDDLVKASLIIDLKDQNVGKAVFKTGRFDVVLEPLS